MCATRVDERVELSERRLLALMREGVTSVEIKSGYDLDLDDELKLVELPRSHGRSARAVAVDQPVGDPSSKSTLIATLKIAQSTAVLLCILVSNFSQR